MKIQQQKYQFYSILCENSNATFKTKIGKAIFKAMGDSPELRQLDNLRY